MKKTIATVASFAFLFVVVSPTHAATISGNGIKSVNKVKVSSVTSATLLQTNKTTYTNTVVTSSSTGGNNANGNTGSGVSVTSGDASNVVDLTNVANVNNALAGDPCGCSCNTPVDATISGNGIGSWNTVWLWTSCSNFTDQWNSAHLTNTVVTSSTSGGNTANGNTGGTVDVSTGGSSSEVTITNTANSNTSL